MRPKPKQTTRKQRVPVEPVEPAQQEQEQEQITPPENDLFNAIDAIQKSLTPEEKENITINNIIARLRDDYKYDDAVLKENKPAIKKHVMDTF